MSLISITACHTERDNFVAFLGDSIIARWDIEYVFPSHQVKNYGVSGSGIKYLESMKGQFSNKTVVIISGTNDLYLAKESGYDIYSKRYIKALENLNAQKIILFPILPRIQTTDDPKINEKVDQLNSAIKTEVKNSGLNIVYLNGVNEDFLKDGEINMNLFYDGLHPNKYGYEILEYYVYKYI